MLLLSHTTLRLVRGRRYGICAGNGSGKSTLLRAIRDGKVEGFPSQDEVRAVMVEHSLQGEDASLPIIDFIASGECHPLNDFTFPELTEHIVNADKQLKGIARTAIAAQLEEVGFDAERQSLTVGSLSGGWKMKVRVFSLITVPTCNLI